MSRRGWLALVASLAALWAASLVAAPLAIPPGTVAGLHGRANFMDYSDRWGALPAFPAAVYAIGDFVCHQMAERSWSLGGNQVPVDVRLLGAFLAAPFGVAAAGRLTPRPTARAELASALPAWLRRRVESPRSTGWLLLAAWALAVVPTAIDGGLELTGSYDSGPARRLVTGILLGGLGAFLSTLTLDSLLAPTTRGDGAERMPGRSSRA